MNHRSELLLGPEALERLGRTRVILFGVGGVGSWCAEALVRSGIGHLTVVDSDLICVTNLNRQVQATAVNIGRSKVDELRGRLLSIRPDADVLAIRKIYDADSRDEFALDSYDYVIDAIDSLASKLDLIVSAYAARPVLLSSMGASCKLDPTRIRVDSIWRSARCPLARLVRQRLRRRGFDGDFLCVYSDEPVRPPHHVDTICGTERCYCPRAAQGEEGAPEAHEWCSSKAQINGSVVHITASFGMFLAGLVIQQVAGSGSGQEPPGGVIAKNAIVT
ncbi:MAG: tRNA threonylcarbamoyladenosine dehydratase [bacterium]